MGSIWSDNFLSQLSTDAEQQVNKDVPCIFHRFYLPSVAGLSVYTLPPYVRSLIRITWLGYGLDQANWEELTLLTPATVFVAPGSSQNIETSNSRPLYYAMHPTNPYDIRLYPCPNLNLSTDGNPYTCTTNEQRCTISCFTDIDTTFSDPTRLLPIYIDRRIRKAYVLWKAYSAEGVGQNSQAAKYYESKYNLLIENFRLINDGAFVGKKYSLDDRGLLTSDGFRYPRPTLPPNFERVVF